MWIRDFINCVSSKICKIGKTVRNEAPAKIKQYAEKIRPALWSFAGGLAKQFLLTTVPGGRLLWKYLKGPVQQIQSVGSSSGELKDRRERISRLEPRETSSPERMTERIFKLEQENSEIRERNFQCP